VLYTIWEFERFKRTFAVNVASEYYAVLRAMDQITNEEGNYRRVSTSVRRSRRLAEAGDIDIVQVDQAVQDELRARNRWVLTMQSYERALDEFKILLGLPVDANIELDRGELDQLVAVVSETIVDLSRFAVDPNEEIPPADAPIQLEPPSQEGAGQYEIDRALAMRLALENRLDLRVSQENVYDAQRTVVVFADRLGAELTLFGSASAGDRRSVGSATSDDSRIRLNEAAYSALFTLDLPLERIAERNDYRNSLVSLERAVRDVGSLEDQVKLDVRNRLRALGSTRESLQIQARAVEVAQQRVSSANMLLEAGRVQIRDILEAQEALLSAQNALTAAVINYRITELELQQDMGLLKVDEKGLWQEFDPEAIK
jgi:outer membrane protein TolC